MWRASIPCGVEQVGEHLVKREHYDPHWEQRAARASIYERTSLFGLTLSSDRRVPFERIDPKAARELFIRHALVRMEYDNRAPFLAHNRKLLEDTEYLQQKGRRVDLLADEGRLFDFFDARIPEGMAQWRGLRALAARSRGRKSQAAVHGGERHRRQRGCARSRALPRSHDCRSAGGPAALPASIRATRTMACPRWCLLHVLNQLPEEPFAWLVPACSTRK